MKEIRIKWKWIKREVIILLLVYLLANCINLGAIAWYGTPWSELFSSQGYVLYLTEWLYITSALVRLLYFGAMLLFKKK